MIDETYYTVLRIFETATQDDIERAYRTFMEAYHVVSDATRRSSYDQDLAQQRRQRYAPAPQAQLMAALEPLPSVETFAKQMEISIDEAQNLLAGKTPMTRALARKLQSVLGGSLEFWISYDFGEESRGVNPWFAMVGLIFLIGLGYIALNIISAVP